MNKSQWKIAAVAAAIIFAVIAFMTGLMGIMDNLNAVRDSGKVYHDFKASLDTFEGNEEFLASGKDDYEIQKAYASYEVRLDEHNLSVRQFNEDVLDYNTKLITYSVGKNALSSGESAYNEGRKQLDDGWAAYNSGKEAYEEGSAAYQEKVEEYNKGIEMYNFVISTLSSLEQAGMSHSDALALISAQAGMTVTDESLMQMKQGLDMAASMLPEGEKQMAEAKAQLEAAYTGLQSGEAGLNQAKQQLDSGKAQMNSIKNEIAGGTGGLDSESDELEKAKADLDAEKETLDAQAEELKVYEKVHEKSDRQREKLIDSGYGTEKDDNATLLKSARVHENDLKSDYLKTLISYIVEYAAHFLALAGAIAALVILRKKNLSTAKKLAIAAVALGLLSVAASIVFGSLDSFAFACAVCAAAGVGLTEAPVEE